MVYFMVFTIVTKVQFAPFLIVNKNLKEANLSGLLC